MYAIDQAVIKTIFSTFQNEHVAPNNIQGNQNNLSILE